MRAAPMDANWGNFQSFIQLAIALNSAFAAFGSYAGNDVTKEKARIARIMRAVENGAKLPALNGSKSVSKSDLILFEGRCEHLLYQYNDFVTGTYRVVCVATAGAGIGLLLYSSVFPNLSVSPFWAFITLLFYIPFYFGLYRVGKLSFDIYVSVSLKTKHIEEQIKNQPLRAPTASGGGVCL